MQSKIYKCQWALTGVKGLSGDIVFDDVAVNPLTPKGFAIDE